MNMNTPVGIVILNWNKREDLLRCLAAVKAQTVTPKRVLVVDNGSTDGSVEAVRSAWPDTELLVHEHNLGGTAGFNSGLRKLLEDDSLQYIHLLDNDAFLEPDALSALVRHLEANPETGLAGSKLLVQGSKNRLQEFGAQIDWERFSIAPAGAGCEDGPEFQSDRIVDYVPACSCMVRTQALRDVELMDEGCF
jgi:GT2 family glycosyltransferase